VQPQVQQLHSYRATLVPDSVPADEVEFQANNGLLPTLRLKAPNAEKAMADAHRVSGKAVHNVARVEPAEAPQEDVFA
jgi:hypothetical protein